MKKIIIIAISLIAILSLLAGCGGKTNNNQKGAFENPEGMSGSDVARLLLANERLDATYLKSDGNIFDNGVETMNALIEKATNNLNVQYKSSNVSYLAGTRETLSDASTRGKLEKDNEKFYWSNFTEYNNTYEYFESLTENIVSSAELAAELIDSIKKNVRVVDKWVKVDDTVKYYLHVEENSELLIEHYTADGLDLLKICLRYKNEEGKNVYEVYRNSVTEQYLERMLYIPGERYEISMKHDVGGSVGSDCFVADYSKGYWETCILGFIDGREHVNASYFIMKDNLCYDAFYNMREEVVTSISVMSADSATDIFGINLGNYVMSLNLNIGGFDGIESISAKISDVEYNEEGKFANISNGEVATVNFKNGKVAKYGDKFVDGAVEVGSIHAGYYAGDVYMGEMHLNISGDTEAEQFANFKKFIAEVGLECRRDLDLIIAGVDASYKDIEGISKYYKWNGVLINTGAGAFEALNKENERFDEMYARYTAVKDAATISINDTAAMELNINFAPITAQSFEGVSFNSMKVNISKISLTVEDTLLYVVDEPYKIMLALADTEGGLIHFDVENASTVKYADEDTFTVSATDIKTTLPTLSPGAYTLVAYVATSDGIRASGFTPVLVDTVSGTESSNGNVLAKAQKGDNGVLTLTYSTVEDFMLMLETEKELSYQEFEEMISEIVFEYGTPSEVIEREFDGVYKALNGNEDKIAGGNYRIKYTAENGSQTVEGYVFIQYSVI